MSVTITIPVAPISRKILLTIHRELPIRLNNHDLLFHQLSYTRVRLQSNTQKHQKALTSSIAFVVSEKLASRLRNHVYEVGYHLYQQHKNKMMEYIEAQTEIDFEATASLKTFYNHYNIDEDDFDFETAYRYWKRYKTKKSTIISLKKIPQGVPSFSKKYNIILDYAQSEKASALFTKISNTLIPSLHKKFSIQARCFFHYNYSTNTLSDVQKLMNASSFQIVAYSNQAMKNTIQNIPALRDVIKYCIEQQLHI